MTQELRSQEWWTPSRPDRMGVIVEGGEHSTGVRVGEHVSIDGEPWTVRGIEWPHHREFSSLWVQKGHH